MGLDANHYQVDQIKDLELKAMEREIPFAQCPKPDTSIYLGRAMFRDL